MPAIRAASWENVDALSGPRVVLGWRGAEAFIQGDSRNARVFLVADPAAARAEPARSLLDSLFRSCDVRRFDRIAPNPTFELVDSALDALAGFDPHLIVAFGGGTAMDLAKLIAAACAQPERWPDIAMGRQPALRSAVNLLCIPTTAGTGSEATQFAVVYVNGRKHSVSHPTLLPDVAVLDPIFTESLPTSVACSAALDTLSQAIESLWAVGATEESCEFAQQALHLAWTHLPEAALSARRTDRQQMLLAAHLAGRAINISRTTACHACSYVLTSAFGVPHGKAVALTLPAMLRFNALVTDEDCVDPRGPEHVRQRIADLMTTLGACDIDDACAQLTDLIARLSGPVRLGDLGALADDALENIVMNVNVERLGNNPRRLSAGRLRDLLKSIQ